MSISTAFSPNVLLSSSFNHIPIFTLNCSWYPDICDNHCNAGFCHGFNSPNVYLHYDPEASSDHPNRETSLTAVDYRLQDIGCGDENYCSAIGKNCSEFPYASTYDGGLGCINARYQGADALAVTGTTLCADPIQVARHERALTRFYADRGLDDSAPFQIGLELSNFNESPLCTALLARGSEACPNVTTTDYRFLSTPSGSFCPGRGFPIPDGNKKALTSRERETTKDENVAMHRVTTTKGQEIMIMFGRKPEVGAPVWRSGDDEMGEVDTIAFVH